MRAENPVRGSDQRELLSQPSGRDDHRSCRRRFVFLLITRVAAWVRLSRRKEAWQTAEILIRATSWPCQRRQPRRPELKWADPGPPGDPARCDTESAAPGAAVAGHPRHDPARHRDIARGRWAARSMRCVPALPIRRHIKALVLRTPNWDTRRDPRGTGWPGSAGGGVGGAGDSGECRNRPSAATDRACLVTVSAFPRRRFGGMGLRTHPAIHRTIPPLVTGPWLAELLPGPPEHHLPGRAALSGGSHQRGRPWRRGERDGSGQPGVSGRPPGDAASALPAALSARVPPACQPAGPPSLPEPLSLAGRCQVVMPVMRR